MNNLNPEIKYPQSFKKMVVLDLVTSGSSLKTIAEKYNLPHYNTVGVWRREMIRKYGEDLAQVLPEQSIPLIQDQKEQGDKRILQLQKALEHAQLKIVALETMIDIAENDFKIPIRKKGGSKQS